ncbi:hypothetical protein B0H14DRAFT_3138957 [Mycena olivaceomarginata]|nr:hypothetical protein B0H14DRAFT_3138957 [Mycena olivaceomarginata]
MFSASSPRELVLILVLLQLLSCVIVGVCMGSAAKRATIVIEASEETNESDDNLWGSELQDGRKEGPPGLEGLQLRRRENDRLGVEYDDITILYILKRVTLPVARAREDS